MTTELDTKTITSLPTDGLAKLICDGLTRGVAEISIACQMLVYAIDHRDDSEELLEKISDQNHIFTRGVLRGLEKVGRRLLHPLLLFPTNKPGLNRLRKLPFPLQERHIRDPIRVAIKRDGGEWDEILQMASDMADDVADQVFDGDAIRTVVEQKQWLLTHRNKATEEPSQVVAPLYKFHRNTVTILKPCELTVVDLVTMIARLEKSR